MSATRSPILSLRARGPLACFTRPELKAERLSYEVPTPSAARGLLEAVLWKPAMAWRLKRIRVLAPIRFLAIRRNEVNNKASAPKAATVEAGGLVEPYYADDDRAQRATFALRDVDYVIEAAIELTPQAGPNDNLTKFVDMFERRLEKGQCFQQPYFGCREFVAEIAPAADTPPPIALSKDLGLMLWDLDYRADGSRRPRFFAARLEHGVLHVPENPEATLPRAAAGGAA